MGKPPARSRITREREARTVAFAEAKDGKKSKKGAAGEPEKSAPVEGGESESEAPADTLEVKAEEPAAVAAESPAPTPAPPPAPTPPSPPPPIAATAPPTAVEEPTHLPHPRDVPAGSPDEAAPPPGRVPPGDSRSLRNAAQFALIYRIGTFVITRVGTVGKRGEWRVVEYPTSAAASHAYAKESSRFVSEGFSDYRD